MLSVQNRKISLGELFSDMTVEDLPQNLAVVGLTDDSREVEEGYLFLACKGLRQDGKKFIDAAVKAGAIAVAIDASDISVLPELRSKFSSTCFFSVNDLSQNLGHIASRYFQYPSLKLRTIGITGTNGKTSCSFLLAQALQSDAARCGIVGTLGSGYLANLNETGHTTPGAIQLQRILKNLLNDGATHVAMEVSSHALDQNRVGGVNFQVVMFSNLTQDHLDYHGNMDAYAEAKLKLFRWPGIEFAILNLDDPFTSRILTVIPSSVTIVGITSKDNRYPSHIKVLRAIETAYQNDGTQILLRSPWGQATLHSKLLGEFNVHNLLLVIACALVLDFSLQDVIARLAKANPPPGRVEMFTASAAPIVVVDYAHTPDALEKVLRTLQQHCNGKLLVLFGCGGDRDKGKRPLMGRVAEAQADIIWLTNDNPRTEEPQQIIQDILAGIQNPSKVHVEMDRRRAIAGIIKQAHPDDVVLVAGKGHETYQIVGNNRYDFSDREVVASCLGVAA